VTSKLIKRGPSLLLISSVFLYTLLIPIEYKSYGMIFYFLLRVIFKLDFNVFAPFDSPYLILIVSGANFVVSDKSHICITTRAVAK
jgi:hypothetical protein